MSETWTVPVVRLMLAVDSKIKTLVLLLLTYHTGT